MPRSPWTFLCPRVSNVEQKPLKSSHFSLPTFTFGLLGSTLIILLLSQPQRPRYVTILCREIHLIRQRPQEEVMDWQLQLSRELKVSAQQIQWTDHSGSIYPSLKKLIQHASDLESWEQPQNLGTDIYVASSMLFEQDKLLGSPFMYPPQWHGDRIKAIFADPVRHQLIIHLESNLNSMTIKLKNSAGTIVERETASSLNLGATEWPWPHEPSILELSNEQGGLLDSIHIPPSPSHPLHWTTSMPITSSLTQALNEFRTHQPHQLMLHSGSSEKKKWQSRAQWIFLDAPSPMTAPIPSGLPRVAQSSSFLNDPIFHAPFDWPMSPWPSLYLDLEQHSSGEQVLLSASHFPLIIKKKGMSPILYFSIASNLDVQSQLWPLLLQSSFPTNHLQWSRFDLQQPKLSPPKANSPALSAEMQLLLALSATCFFVAFLIFYKYSRGVDRHNFVFFYAYIVPILYLSLNP